MPMPGGGSLCACVAGFTLHHGGSFPYFSSFFSSRRRHTRFDCDWSSDVCSSDLDDLRIEDITQEHLVRLEWPGLQEAAGDPEADLLGGEALDRVPGDQRHPAAVRTHAQSRYPRQRIPQVDGHVPDGAQPDALGIDDWRTNEPAGT